MWWGTKEGTVAEGRGTLKKSEGKKMWSTVQARSEKQGSKCEKKCGEEGRGVRDAHGVLTSKDGDWLERRSPRKSSGHSNISERV